MDKMNLSLVVVVVAILYLDLCHASFWDQNHGPRPQTLQRLGRDRPRPLRHHRHIQAHHGYHRPHPRVHRPMPPPGHRRRSRPPPHFRHGPVFQNQGQMLIQPMVHPRLPHNGVQQTTPSRHELAAQFFKQDEIIQEQSKHFPVTTMAIPNQHAASTLQSVTESQPHGYLSSTYKGWKPIVKPYQNSYLGRPNENAGKSDYRQRPSFMMNGPQQNNIHQTQPHSLNQNMNFNTLFRENTEHMKPPTSLKSAYSENQGIRVPPPPSDVRGNRGNGPPSPQPLPSSTPSWSHRFPGPMGSHSEEIAIIKKPFNKQKLPPKPPQNHPGTTRAPLPHEGFEDGPKFPKFKFRPRPRPGPFSKDIVSEIQGENSGPPKSTFPPFIQQQSEEIVTLPQDQQSLNLKAKLSSRGRVRVRTKTVKPDQSSQSEEEGAPSSPKPLSPFVPQTVQNAESVNGESFPGRRQPNSGPNYGPPRGIVAVNSPTIEEIEDQIPQGPPPPSQQNRNTRGPGRHSNHVKNTNDVKFSSPNPGPNRHRQTEHRTTRPQPTFSDRPAPESQFGLGPSETTESAQNSNTGVENQQFKERKKRPKGDQKNNNIDTQQPQQPAAFPEGPAFLDDFYFPPGFSPDPSKNTGSPVSFMTMPGSKPQVIHHTYNAHRPHTQQQLYPINVMRSPTTDLEFQRPNHGHESNLNGNHIPNNRPRYVTLNPQNGGGQHHGRNPSYHHNQHNQHNPTIYPSNSNHESAYYPHAFGSNISPYTYSGPYPPRHMAHSLMSPAAQHNVPLRMSPIPSTTMRNVYYPSSAPPYSVPYEVSSTLSSVEVRDSTEASQYPHPPRHTQPPLASSTYPPTSPRTVYVPAQNINIPRTPIQPPPHYQEHGPSYGSVEYDKIPMQFMDQLRPILREQQTTTPNGRHTHQSPDIHPPSTFFDDFFQPFDQTFNANPEQELDSKSSSPVPNQVRAPFTNMGFDTHKAQSSSPQAQVVSHPVRNTFPSSTSTYSGFTRSPSNSVNYQTPEATSVRDAEFDEINAYSQASWSKRKENEVAVSSTEVVPQSPMSQQKKTSKVNQNKQPTTTVKSRIEPTKSKPKESYSGQDQKTERIPIVTTYKPSDHLEFIKIGEDPLPEETSNVRQVDTESSLPHEDDLSDSNTPKSVRVRGREKEEKITLTTELPEGSTPTTASKSRRHFRRRRPDAAVRRRYFSSRVKAAAEEEKQTSTSTLKSQPLDRLKANEEPNPIEESDDGYELSRISALKHRRLFQRRRNLGSNRAKGVVAKDVPHSTKPSLSSSTESQAVTYGESQWFRIKPTDSSELDQSAFQLGDKQMLPETSVSVSKSVSGADQHKKVSPSMSDVELLPLESSSEASSPEAGSLKPSYSSKHSVSFVEDRKFSTHKKSS